VVIVIKQYSETLKAAAEKGPADTVRELLKRGAVMNISKKCG